MVIRNYHWLSLAERYRLLDAVYRWLFSTRREGVYRVGNDGRPAVHGVHLAHGHHLGRPLLLVSLPAALPAHQVSRLRRGQDRVRLDRICRNLLVAGRRWPRQPVQRLPRRPLRTCCPRVRHLRLDVRVLRAARGDVRDVHADGEDAPVGQGEVRVHDVAASASASVCRRLASGAEVDNPRRQRDLVGLRRGLSVDGWVGAAGRPH